MLKDLLQLLKPLMSMTIDEEGELYVTSSTVVPRFWSAKCDINKIFSEACGSPSESRSIINPRVVSSWRTTFNNLWDDYLEEFLYDYLFLAATILDPRSGCGHRLSEHILESAMATLRKMLEDKFKKL